MNTNLTEVIFILDRSGSMAHLTEDTIGGFNSFILKQMEEPGELKLTTILFDDKYEVLHNGLNVKDVAMLTKSDYWARGMTALLDAVGRTIDDVGMRLDKTPEDQRPGKVLVVITTDGLENASRKYSVDAVRQLIELQTNVYKWQFIFLGANIDAVATAKGLGINTSANYTATSSGTRSLYDTVSNVSRTVRSGGTIDKDWDKDLK